LEIFARTLQSAPKDCPKRNAHTRHCRVWAWSFRRKNERLAAGEKIGYNRPFVSGGTFAAIVSDIKQKRLTQLIVA
jgi:hypothetical protein